MPRTTGRRLFVANQTGVVSDPDEGVPYTLVAGRTIVDDQDPIYRAHSHMFSPVEPRPYRRVEQATAAPGERRG